MFDQWIDECRLALAKRQRSLASRLGLRHPVNDLGRISRVYNSCIPHYKVLLRFGRVVWSAVVQANTGLLVSGENDLPANTLLSPSIYFDRNPAHLVDIAHSLFEMKGSPPADPELRRVSEIVTNETNNASNELLPMKLADGHEVYLTTTIIHRMCLPRKTLSDNLLPMVICPEQTHANMILPRDMWAADMKRQWGNLAELMRTSTEQRVVSSGDLQFTPFPRDPQTPSQETLNTDQLIELTEFAANQIQRFGKERSAATVDRLRVGIQRDGSAYRYELKFDATFDPEVDLRHTSRGYEIIVRKDCAPMLQGTVIDYHATSAVQGFVFHNPHER